MNPRRRQVANSLRRDRASSLHLSHSDAETEQYEQHIAQMDKYRPSLMDSRE